MKKIIVVERGFAGGDLDKKKTNNVPYISSELTLGTSYLGIFEKLISIMLLIAVVCAVYISLTNSEYFEKLVEEDGFYENLTALFLFLSSFTLALKFLKLQSYYSKAWKFGVMLMVAGLFFGAGEEISWGQRIFNIQSSEFFKINNAQQETNLHNLVVGKVKLNKLIFSNVLSIGFGFYFLVLPILWLKVSKVRAFINKFGIPVARPVHILIFLMATLLILILISSSKKWEVWEYAFALIMFLIVYNPINTKEIFSKK
ncbi:hypothetical protein C1637_22710 [Chryseobacterium lactis]|nr:hypothetical protein [Chryseobacterium lactis]AZB05514.1 hypothetical protein EG341_16750 [Chryseobacterium lactis]PNW11352.1 hypothetical protein C1637_22710 [Chryseobacterium lactis]